MSWIGGGEKELTAKYNGKPWIKPWGNRGGTSMGKLHKRREGLQVLTSTNTNYLAAAAAKSLQSCPTLCDPIDGSYQAPPSLGFSRQEHWSGLPFPSPMHESEK